ncbi:hypothetical protein C5F59_007665 [Streptomyces sp. QL37]|uniref:hypothetical protein n=1 Tax=Streptomyces sp. QL37 TaxID=2093747 RepID=UPI000CF2D93F|nr:hypothetical protein [Streptomyces sp. QL37]PPQ56563.1 hypothetical protein C5F59_07740 [Streptomyces sp. QL37]
MPPIIWKTSWKPGPAAHSTGPGSAVVVSVTEFVTHRPWGTPAVATEGFRLRRSWPSTPGAVAIRLWMDIGPRLDRSGSVTVWTDEASLMRFVARPDHVRVVRAFRGRGVTRSLLRGTTPAALSEPGARPESAADPRLGPVWAYAERILTGAEPWS